MSDAMEMEIPEGIAVVAVAGRFPGARTPEALWQLLLDEREGVTFFTDEQLRAAGVPDEVLASPDYVRAAGALEDVDQFDAAFFGMTPGEAALMPPEQRLFLEVAWEALERSGHPARGKRVGVFGGTGFNTYLLRNAWPAIQAAGDDGFYQMLLANSPDHLAARVAYRLDLRGPALTVQAACSTSMVAVHQACQSLLMGECDLALAGGASVAVPHGVGYLYEEGGILSPDGHCRPFDARAAGTVPSSGAAMVALRRVEDAVADGDTILAVIRGSAINNDGARKMGYAAPSVDGQAAVIAEALAVAGVEPETVSYVEAHSTATSLGDPIEVTALTRVYGAAARTGGRIRIGSAKANVGHTDTAAGVTGLIKTVFSLHHRRIAAVPHFQAPNPTIDFAASPFQVADEGTAWATEDGVPRRAGVSSFGVGGTNAHVVVEEAPRTPSAPSRRAWQLLPLSARTDAALAQARTELAAHLRTEDGYLPDAAFTLQAGRQGFAQRCAVVAADAHGAAAALESGEGMMAGRAGATPSVAFLFPGQGAQHPGMGRGLYETEPAYRSIVDRCADLLRPLIGMDIRELLFPAAGDEDAAAERLRSTAVAQPALFVTEYATAKLWMEWGVRPAAMLGHSIGEYAAACLAGVFTLEDALSLVAARGRLMQALPPGVMLSVALPADEARALLDGTLAVAGDNAPRSCVVSGAEAAVAALEARLGAMDVRHKRLHTSHAFHSPMMDPALDEFTAVVARVPRRAPELPWISNLTGTWITADEAQDPSYWAKHLRQTVRFREGAAALLAMPNVVLLEVGPGQSLSALVEAQDGGADARLIASMRQPGETVDDGAFLMRALGGLWVEGVEIDWSGVWKHERRRRVRLPTYPFQRSRHWIDAPAETPKLATLSASAHSAAPAAAAAITIPAEALEALISGQIGVMSRQAQLLATADDAALDGGAPRVGAPAESAARMTPGQRAWLEQEPRDPDHYNHAFAFDLAAPLDTGRLRAALAAVVAHHPALRTGCVRGADGWTPAALQAEAAFAVSDALVAEETFERQSEQLAEAAQAGMGVDGGPLVRAIHLHCGAGLPARLIVIVHAFAADRASCAVLLDDLRTAYAQLQRGESVSLAPATTSVAAWVAKLEAHAGALRTEAAAWLALEDEDVRPLPRDHAAAPNLEADAREEMTLLDAAPTAALLADPRADETVLAALGHVLAEWAGGAVLVERETEGRAPLFADVDLSRTVGWLGAAHPVALRPESADAAEALRRVRSRLRRIANGGVGYGVLRHLGADRALARRLAALAPAETVFRFVPPAGDGGVFGAPSDAPLGPVRSRRERRAPLLEVTCTPVEGRLAVRWRYSHTVHHPQTIARLAGRLLARLRDSIAPVSANAAHVDGFPFASHEEAR